MDMTFSSTGQGATATRMPITDGRFNRCVALPPEAHNERLPVAGCRKRVPGTCSDRESHKSPRSPTGAGKKRNEKGNGDIFEAPPANASFVSWKSGIFRLS